MIKSLRQNQGSALLLSLIIVLSISVLIGSGLSFLVLSGAANADNKIKSTQSYYLAEAGIEDILLRLKGNMQIINPNVIAIDGQSVTVEISDEIGGSRTIISQGNSDERVKKVAVTYTITSDQIDFFYGAQAGEGGIIMGNNSQIIGNVFSNGNISGQGEITGTAILSNDSLIEDAGVGMDVYTYSCNNVDIGGILYYLPDGSINECNYASAQEIDSIEPEDLPISESQINDWKNQAAAGEIIYGDYTVSENESLGPVKITGSLNIANNAFLNVTGAIYVQGNLNTSNNSIVQLDSGYGSLSGVIVADGKIRLDNNAIMQGSGQSGSYLMLLSTNSSIDLGDPAVDLKNNAGGAIFYASQGVIYLHNNINVREATGYKLAIDNNAVISYDIGLENVNFSCGPGGGWNVEDWREIE